MEDLVLLNYITSSNRLVIVIDQVDWFSGWVMSPISGKGDLQGPFFSDTAPFLKGEHRDQSAAFREWYATLHSFCISVSGVLCEQMTPSPHSNNKIPWSQQQEIGPRPEWGFCFRSRVAEHIAAIWEICKQKRYDRCDEKPPLALWGAPSTTYYHDSRS